jgi:hypothetical protein
MLARHLDRELGRVYRKFLAAGFVVRINGAPVSIRDPITVVPSPSIEGSVRELPLLTFTFADPRNAARESEVCVRFTVLPVASWSRLPDDLKRELGISNGACVSILRADREIALGWHLLGKKKRENYDDWWRCEVSFKPDLDELFGVTNSKQGIRPAAELIDSLVPSLEEEARRLNCEVRKRFRALKTPAERAMQTADRAHPALCSAPSSELKRLRPGEIMHLGRVKYRIRLQGFSGPNFMEVSRSSGVIELVINTYHPFFSALYKPMQSAELGRPAVSFDLWLLALGRALSRYRAEPPRAVAELIEQWSDASALFLDEQ